MNKPAPRILAVLCAALAAASPAFAQYAPYPPPQYAAAGIYSQQQIEAVVAPIALYPDGLLSQILMASTYPLEIQEADRWLRSNPGLAGEQAVRLAAQSGWDPSVQSLSAFPQIVSMMSDNLAWTESLGEAFLAQQPYVMDAVQVLRRRAWAAGTLRSDTYITVIQRGTFIEIEPAQPQVVYVPYYDPLVVYGTWVYPAYPPVRFRPWPGYRPGVPFAWGPAVAVTGGVLFGQVDWGRRNVLVHEWHPGVERREGLPRPWLYAPEHRRGVPYRHEELRRRFAQQGPHDRAPRQGHSV